MKKRLGVAAFTPRYKSGASRTSQKGPRRRRNDGHPMHGVSSAYCDSGSHPESKSSHQTRRFSSIASEAVDGYWSGTREPSRRTTSSASRPAFS